MRRALSQSWKFLQILNLSCGTLKEEASLRTSYCCDCEFGNENIAIFNDFLFSSSSSYGCVHLRNDSFCKTKSYQRMTSHSVSGNGMTESCISKSFCSLGQPAPAAVCSGVSACTPALPWTQQEGWQRRVSCFSKSLLCQAKFTYC